MTSVDATPAAPLAVVEVVAVVEALFEALLWSLLATAPAVLVVALIEASEVEEVLLLATPFVLLLPLREVLEVLDGEEAEVLLVADD